MPEIPVQAPVSYRFEELEPFRGELVTVLALPAGDGPDSEGEPRSDPGANPGYDPTDLAAELSTAVAAMAPRVPLDSEALRAEPLTVAVEASHPQQILHAGDVGEAVLGGPADVHLVFHPDDGFAYRHALAQALMRRRGLGQDLPPYLRLGAAWWLMDAGGGTRWYGRSRNDWLRRLASAEVLPTVDELLAAEELPDGSRLLWTPVAAKVIDDLPGETLEEKLGEAGEADLRAGAARLLAGLEGAVALRRSRGGGVGGAVPEDAAQDPALRDAGRTPGSSGLVGSGVVDSGSPGLVGSGVGDPGSSGLVGGLEGSGVGGSEASGLVGSGGSRRDPLPPFLAGVSLAMLNHVELGYHAPSVDAALANLRRSLGANAVSLMPFAYQRRPDDPALVYLNHRPRSETDAAMLHAGRRADLRRFAVLWKPQIWLSGSWPGEVAMATEEDWQAWFRSYRRFLVHQAVLADRVGAEMYSVGVELGRTVERREDWERLIDAVELFYDGPLTYSANWYGDFDRVTFWDRLDYLGLDAYEPLSADPEATDADLAAGARRVVEGMAASARKHGKPLILTEVGFAAHEAAWVAPHEEGGPLSPEDQARAWNALLGALAKAGDAPGRPPEWLKGLFAWKAFSSGPRDPGGEERGERGEDFADFRFLGRPAEEVLSGYFQGWSAD